MGFSVGLRAWSDVDAGIVASVREFGTQFGKRPGETLDDRWWKATLAKVPVGVSGLNGHYGSPEAYALEDVINDKLGLSRWADRPKGAVQWLMWAPFSFAGGWTRRTAGDLAIVVGDPTALKRPKYAMEKTMRRLFDAGWEQCVPALVYW